MCPNALLGSMARTGWHGQPARHALAAKGVRTRPKPVKRFDISDTINEEPASQFYLIEYLPPGARKIKEIPENYHVFYRRDDRLFLRNCCGDILEVDPGSHTYSLKEISDEFEMLDDPWGPAR